MVNAWSLLDSEINGTMDEDYPIKHSKYYYDYDRNDPNAPNPFKEEMTAHYFKYHEEQILKDIEEYVSGTYRGHYTGTKHEYRNVQTIDLMASRAVSYTHLTLPTICSV